MDAAAGRGGLRHGVEAQEHADGGGEADAEREEDAAGHCG
jgi:hypothetical protein